MMYDNINAHTQMLCCGFSVSYVQSHEPIGHAVLSVMERKLDNMEVSWNEN